MRGCAAVEDPLAAVAVLRLDGHLVQRGDEGGLIPLRRWSGRSSRRGVDGEREWCGRCRRMRSEDAGRSSPRLEGARHRWCCRGGPMARYQSRRRRSSWRGVEEVAAEGWI